MENQNSAPETVSENLGHDVIHPQKRVKIDINGRIYEVAAGRHTVLDLKKLAGIPLADELERVVHQRLVPLPDDGAVEVHECEWFVSHIIPWKENVGRRADPRNGIALNALYDRAFDRGLMTLDEGMRVVISGRLRGGDVPMLQRQAFGELEGRRLRMPCRFGPDAGALAWHREQVFA